MCDGSHDELAAEKKLTRSRRTLVSQFSKFVSLVPYLPDELQGIAMQVREPGRLTDLVASYLKIAVEEAQDLLSSIEFGSGWRSSSPS